jgi:hypothetical protein
LKTEGQGNTTRRHVASKKIRDRSPLVRLPGAILTSLLPYGLVVGKVQTATPQSDAENVVMSSTISLLTWMIVVMVGLSSDVAQLSYG